jgi:hypothetical protein
MALTPKSLSAIGGRLFIFHQLGSLALLLREAGMPSADIQSNLNDLQANGTGGQGVVNILNWLVANAPEILQIVLSILTALSAAGV